MRCPSLDVWCASEEATESAQGLTRAVGVLDQGKADMLISAFPKPDPW
jgi:hypothetical protein